MADYRLDCCGGFPSHNKNCQALATAPYRKEAKEKEKALLDALYTRYGEYEALTQRARDDHSKLVYGLRAEGILEAICIIEDRPYVMLNRPGQDR